MRVQHGSRSFSATLFVLLALGAGCEADYGEVPEMDEVEGGPEASGIELREDLMLGPGDVGETFMMNGEIVGRRLGGEGFFVETDWNRRLFVASSDVPPPGTPVRVIGTLAAVDMATFEAWEREAFGGEVEDEWDLERRYYLEAERVQPLDGPVGEFPRIRDTASVAPAQRDSLPSLDTARSGAPH